jgi:Sulfocyanin (SoxE) domain
MRSARERLTVITLTLAAAAPLRAAQVTGSPQAAPPSREAVDTASSHGAHHHHDGGKHGGGRKWLSFNAATNTVTFKLVAGRPRGSSRLNFNGHANGTATLVVPAKSRVVMHFVNEDSVPHSAAIVADREPAAGPEPAIPQATTRELTRGLPLHGTDVIRFTAPVSGSYRIASGVPGQAHSGMWIRLRVDPTAKAPAWQKHT